MNQTDTQYFKILTIDGGGILGIYPASLMRCIEEKIDGKIFEFFDLIVGNSTGGLIALSLALGKSTKEIESIYLNHGKDIFKRNLFGICGICKPVFSNRKLISIVKEFLGDSLISDCKTRICIPASDVTNQKPVVFKTSHSDQYFVDKNIEAWKIAISTSAAPTFFPAYELEDDMRKGIFVDGGIWANNPALIGFAEAQKLGEKSENIKLLSIGTGRSSKYYSDKKKKANSIISWKLDLIPYVFDIQSLSVDNLMSYLMSDNYYRFNPSINPKYKMHSIKAVNTLKKQAANTFLEKGVELLKNFFTEKVELYK